MVLNPRWRFTSSPKGRILSHYRRNHHCWQWNWRWSHCGRWWWWWCGWTIWTIRWPIAFHCWCCPNRSYHHRHIKSQAHPANRTWTTWTINLYNRSDALCTRHRPNCWTTTTPGCCWRGISTILQSMIGYWINRRFQTRCIVYPTSNPWWHHHHQPQTNPQSTPN